MCTKPGKALACALLALALGGCAAAAPTGARHRVAIVAKSTRTEFWLSVFAGRAGGRGRIQRRAGHLRPRDRGGLRDPEPHGGRGPWTPGPKRWCFSAIDYENNAAAIDAAAAAGVRIVAIDSNVDSAAVQTYIGTDNYAAGQMAAQAALDAVDGELTVGIVNYDISSANGQERERGARDLFEASGRAQVAARINTLAEAGRAQADTEELLRAHPDINVLLAFNEPTSVGAAAAVAAQELSDAVFLVGFDSNLATVEGLQNGSVDALIVQNPYAMGYLGVESAYRLLSGQGGSLAPTVDTATSIVDLENLFTMDSQKALFAFEQRES